MSSIFISHASADRELAVRFADLIRLGCSIRTNEIFCTSVEGAGVRTGEQFSTWIRDALRGAKLVILLVTPSYLASRFCLAEMGALWVQELPVFPLVVPGLPRDLGGPLVGTHTEELGGPGLDHLSERLEALIPEAKTPRTTWNVERDAFLQDLPALLQALKQPDTVSRKELDEAKAEAGHAVARYREVRETVARLEAEIVELRNVKDPAGVAAVRKRYSTEWEQYEELRGRARSALGDLSSPVLRGLFALIRGEGWGPSSDVWTFQRAEMDRAIHSEALKEGHGHVDGWIANEAHPDVADALSVLEELRTFLEDEASPETLEALRSERRVIPDIGNSDFWRSELLRGRTLWE